jgi:ATP-dependent exoDNAse (exonuclease V) beta subunit
VKLPADHAARRRFAEELDRNFSVVAAAGSGKTQSITERIVQIARSAQALTILPKLVVVTFTHRAADQMQQRTRQRILAEHRSSEIQTAFNRAFFGTIHSFCMRLLANYGHHLGLPASLELITDDEDLWEQFVQQHTSIGRNLSEEVRDSLFRLAPARQLMELARNARSVFAPAGSIAPCPTFDFTAVHETSAPRQSEETIANSKAELAEFEKRFQAGWEFVRWPIRSSGAKEFLKRWREAFGPLRSWVAEAALCVAAEVQRDYRDFRLERGVVTYADQVALADELMQHPIAAQRVREENFRVVLDEAQDTEPAQFSVLTEITRPPDATCRWLETQTAPPRPGHFCMVGDFQQSIYRDRADLDYYRAIHAALLREESGEALEFSVTFRLDQRQLDFINATFREILNNKEGQVPFVTLEPRPEVLPGQVIRVSLAADLLPADEKLKDYKKAAIEARELANWIKNTGFEKLRASSWREVAILCPRKLWLRTMATALRRVGLPAAIQSESDLKGDNPAYAWLTALCTVMSDPRNSYEIVGVLREVFGIADHDLAIFAEGKAGRFQIDQELAATGVVSSPLRLLAETRRKIEGRALFDAVNLLVEETELRQRLGVLPPEDFPDLEQDLDWLIALTAEAEANGFTLSDFAEKLRGDYLKQRDVRLAANEGIQLITAQKAKGSEWQAVILPFLGRGIIPPSPRYPCLLKVPGSREPLVALTKEDFDEEGRALNKAAAQQEMARLLYVATTRARHTLVLVYDKELFLDSKKLIPPTAQLKHFGNKEADLFAQFQTSAEIDLPTAEATARSRETSDNPPAFAHVERKERQQALRCADDFVHKFNPSGYDEEIALALDQSEEGPAARPVALVRSREDTPATLYGRWWHSLLQAVPWNDGIDAADAIFQERLTSSPDKRRSANEWKLVRENLRGESMLRQFLSGAGAHAHAEFPFLWSIDNHACVEGVIDLLVMDGTAGRCLLVDWKTNRIKKGEEEDLRPRYRPQIAAYWKAVREITKLEVEAGIFATATGQFVAYDANELEAEWTRLRSLPPDEFGDAISSED